MELPADVSAYGWVPFVIVFMGTVVFSWLYMRYYQSRYDSEVSSTLTAIAGLVVILVVTLLVPVDVFLVSFMKNSDGSFKSWAANSTDRQSYENDILYAYYALYTCLMFFVFLLIPFVYFYYEEGDEESTSGQLLCTALKYTFVVLLVATILLLLGAFIPLKSAPPKNTTEWEKFEFIMDELGKNRGEDALSFIVNVLSSIGMILLIVYTGYGMSAFPFGLIKGSRNPKAEHEECMTTKIVVEAKINAIRDKYRNGRPMRSRDQRELEALEEEERLMSRRMTLLQSQTQSWCNKCLLLLRPFQVVFGALFAAFGLVIFISLLLTCCDKAMHSLGPHSGYVLANRTLPNPVDIILVFAQRVFPLDYVLFLWIVLFFFLSSVSGIQQLGVWFMWIKLYQIRPHRTRPQGLLLLCMMLMLIMLAVNVILNSLIPKYTMYGSQHYLVNGTAIKACSTQAPVDECTMSRMSALLTRFFYKAWVFGAAYYYATWAFLLAIVVGSIVSIFRRPASAIEGAVHKDDFEDDDDLLLRA